MVGFVHLESRATNWEAALSTGLNSLADGSSASSSNFANGTDLYPFMDVSIMLATVTPGTGGYVEIHVLPLMDDGTSYPDVILGNSATQVGSVGFSSGSSAKKETLVQIGLPCGDFKLALVNKVGAANLNASGNTVKIRRYGLNANA